MTEDVLIICGATASGKTALSVHLAKKFNGEIISADSMQIYKGMDVGTAKVTQLEADGVTHHLIDIIEPNENFSVAEYKDLALKAIKEIRSRRKLPIIVGGTGLYVNALIYDYTFNDTTANDAIREKYKMILSEKGAEFLHETLARISPSDAMRLHPNDTFRVIRALEVAELGKTNVYSGKIVMPYKAYAINYPREKLYERINLRVDKMFEEGLLEEVNGLLQQGVTFDCQSMKAIGYKEFKDYFDGVATLDDVREKIKKNSRNYAKRQLTWFRKMPNLIWYDDIEEAKRKIEEDIC